MSAFLDALKNSDELSSVLKAVEDNTLPLAITGLSAVAKGVFASALCEALSRRALIICDEESEASKLAEDLNALCGGAHFMPAKDISPAGTEAKSREYEHKRLGVLAKICEKDYRFIVLSAESAMALTIPKKELTKRIFSIRNRMEIKPEELVSKLLQAGYSRADLVDGAGQFSHRGEIVDFFPPDCENPVRADFWGNTIEGLYSFSANDQRRIENLSEAKIVPALETVFESEEALKNILTSYLKRISRTKNQKAKDSVARDIDRLECGIFPSNVERYLPIAYEGGLESIFDYCKNDLLFVFESARCEKKAKDVSKLTNEEIKSLFESGVLAKDLDKFLLTPAEITAKFEQAGALFFDSLARGSFPVPLKSLHGMSAATAPLWNGKISLFEEDISTIDTKNARIVVMAGTEKNAKAVYNDLISDGVNALYFPEIPASFPKGSVSVIGGTLSSSFYFPTVKFHLFSQGRTTLGKKKGKNRRHRANEIHSLEDINIGDYIVHNIHGIGIYAGVTPVTSLGVTKDYIKINYAKGDVLYVPVTQLDLVSKYIGPSEKSAVKIHSLGSSEWTKTKQRAKKGIVKAAEELLELYAKRQKIEGFAFSPDGDLQRDFELRFAYEETSDQKKCTEEIKKDMCSSHPMDRLLCGDVGFGKTEVALRAAFKAMADGKQVAMLVPTTILAMQHYRTISTRMEAFALNIEMLSRFRSVSEQRDIKSRLKKGLVDMVVGTHKLLSSDLEFRDLGLLIIDEEQRFGVAQKEKIKERFPNVDVLTLSATPIPRTLGMALSGIRDMSVIEEAPQDRYPIQTYVMEYDLDVICEAMKRELRRGGQVYYLHNRVEDIEQCAGVIRSFIPEAKIGIAHGKMSEVQLSSIWQKLLNCEIDILVCTTIIETGIDVPNVNTLIIENADRMGLAQLHQIRGRVGRSNRRASAYLTYEMSGVVNEVAAKRLEAIREFTEFGSGFKIAMRDLEIRGAGNVLGTRQHGQMEAVGYDTYVKLLSEAIAEQRGEVKPAEPDCLVDLPITAHISDSYIPSPAQRIAMYRRIADIKSREDAEDVKEELEDRYGRIPETVEGLIKISLMRARASQAGIYEIKQNGQQIVFRVSDFNLGVLPELKKKLKRVIQLNAGNNKPFLSLKLIKGDNTLEMINETLSIIGGEESA